MPGPGGGAIAVVIAIVAPSAPAGTDTTTAPSAEVTLPPAGPTTFIVPAPDGWAFELQRAEANASMEAMTRERGFIASDICQE